jgi:hypothetical protein
MLQSRHLRATGEQSRPWRFDAQPGPRM